MAFNIVIQTAQFAVNNGSTIEYIRHPRSRTRFSVDSSIYRFYDIEPSINGGADTSLLGDAQVEFLYSNIGTVTEDGVVIPMANESALTIYLSEKLSNYGDSTSSGLTSVAHDATLTGDGTLADPLSVVGVVGAQPIITLSSTINDNVIQSSPTVISWDIEREKDSGFTHNTAVNPSRITVDSDGTYQPKANLTIFSSGARCQFVGRIIIDGVIQPQPYYGGYIRNSGTSSDYWTCTIDSEPIKLNAGQYLEFQIQVSSQITTTIIGVFQGSESSCSIVNLKGEKGDDGAQGAAGTGGETQYNQISSNTNGGTVNAAYGTPLECIPSSGTLSITVAETGSYIIHGKINIGTNLNKDNGAIELMYGVDVGSGAVIGSGIYTQSQQAKKNKANGIQGTWGNVSLNAGNIVHLFLSTLSDSTTWTEGEIYITTWK